MSTWLIVRNDADLETAWREANALLKAFQQVDDGKAGNAMQGIWVDPAMATQPPMELSTFSDSGQELRFKVLESTGLVGIWLICRIEAQDPAHTIHRRDILKALTESSQKADSQASKQMAPVFSPVAEGFEVQAEMQCLAAIADIKGVSLLKPWFQEPFSGHYLMSDREIEH